MKKPSLLQKYPAKVVALRTCGIDHDNLDKHGLSCQSKRLACDSAAFLPISEGLKMAYEMHLQIIRVHFFVST